ncbi:hypothetical protein UPYG_G00044930 [Umbra pygmaea]|uniref:Uncharacterized protein n=1 Tax=Umbra pygmaea TaxID=75934 RepID=A0ABD0XQY8_UMBPY
MVRWPPWRGREESSLRISVSHPWSSTTRPAFFSISPRLQLTLSRKTPVRRNQQLHPTRGGGDPIHGKMLLPVSAMCLASSTSASQEQQVHSSARRQRDWDPVQEED